MHKFQIFPFFIKKKRNPNLLFPFSYKMFIYFLQRKMKENVIKILFHTNANSKYTRKPLKYCHSSSYDFFYKLLYKIVKQLFISCLCNEASSTSTIIISK